MCYFICLTYFVVVPLYSNKKSGAPLLALLVAGAGASSSAVALLRLVGRFTANGRNYNRQRPQMRACGGAAARPQAFAFGSHFPSFARREQSPTNHYKKPLAFVPLVAGVVVVPPQCGATHTTTMLLAPLLQGVPFR